MLWEATMVTPDSRHKAWYQNPIERIFYFHPAFYRFDGFCRVGLSRGWFHFNIKHSACRTVNIGDPKPVQSLAKVALNFEFTVDFQLHLFLGLRGIVVGSECLFPLISFGFCVKTSTLIFTFHHSIQIWEFSWLIFWYHRLPRFLICMAGVYWPVRPGAFVKVGIRFYRCFSAVFFLRRLNGNGFQCWDFFSV